MTTSTNKVREIYSGNNRFELNTMQALQVIFILISCLLASLHLCEGKSLKTARQDVPELQYLNESVNPCEDFYEFTCGNYKNVHPLPEGKEIWDHFAILQEEIHSLAKDILKSPRVQDEPIALQKAKAFYTGCLNTQAMETLNNGYSVHVDFLRKVNKWPAITGNYDDSEKKLSWDDLAELSAKYGLTFYFSFDLSSSLYNSAENALYIQRDILEDPDASAFKPELPKPPGDAKELSYLKFLQNIAYRLRDLSREQSTNDYINSELEKTVEYIDIIIANGIVGNETIPMLFPETTVEDLQTWTDDLFGQNFIDWVSYLNKVISRPNVQITPNTTVLLFDYQMIYGILNLYHLSTTRQVKNYVIARLLTHMAPDSDRFMREKWEEYAEKNNNAVYSRDDYCVRKTLGYSGNIDFSLAVTYEYQRYHFDINKLEKAGQMVNDLHETFMQILEETEWMDELAKETAKEKATKMITILGYPEEIVENITGLNRYYDNLKVCTWDHFGNSQRLRAFELGKQLEPIGHEKRRDLWTMSPLEVNAFYSRGYNKISLPISMLNNIFFSGKYDLLDYARLGAIIGHEITHGFDKSGKDYNAEGVFSDVTWSEDTLAKFQEREECFKDQYSKYYIESIDAYVDGSGTLNENMADNGGLNTAYRAYLKLKASKHLDVPRLTNYTPEQLFFIGFGTMWCTAESNYYTEVLNAQGTYSPGRYRLIGSVSNMPEFADAFKCPKGSKMNPEDKCKMW